MRQHRRLHRRLLHRRQQCSRWQRRVLGGCSECRFVWRCSRWSAGRFFRCSDRLGRWPDRGRGDPCGACAVRRRRMPWGRDSREHTNRNQVEGQRSARAHHERPAARNAARCGGCVDRGGRSDGVWRSPHVDAYFEGGAGARAAVYSACAAESIGDITAAGDRQDERPGPGDRRWFATIDSVSL